MRKIDVTHEQFYDGKLGAHLTCAVVALSDWRKIMRVLRAAEDHRRRIMYTSSPVERALLDSIDALNEEPKK